MSKKKQQKLHEEYAIGDATQHVLSVVKAAGKQADIRQVFAKLQHKFSQQEIVVALHQLEASGSLKFGQKGKLQAMAVEKPARSKHLLGIADVTASGTAYVVVKGSKSDIFVPRKFTNGALQGDEVKVLLKRHGSKPEGEIVEIVKRARESFVGRLEILERFAFFIDEERKLPNDVFVPLNATGNAKHLARVIVRITDWQSGGKNPVGEVVEVLDEKNSIDLDMKLVLMSNGFNTDFPMAVMAECDAISTQIPGTEVEKRLDLRDTLTFTIDPIDAKDFDDAISLKPLKNGRYEIGVHIADVSHYVQEGSALDREAQRRTTSVYLPDRVCPMLPEKLSNELCSLRPHEDKLTFSVLFEMNEQGEILHHTFAKTIIHSRRRYAYEEVQEIFESGVGDFASELKTLLAITKKIRERRFKKGAIAFEKEEVRFRIDENHRPVELMIKVRKDAHLMIEDLMLLANEAVARYGSQLAKGKRKAPFVYRVHDLPDETKLQQFATVAARFGYKISFPDRREAAGTFNTLLKKIEGTPAQNVLESLAIRCMAKAEYTTANIGHYGLAMEHYTHFTSPIRRYPDVMVHRLLFHALRKSDRIIDKEELETACALSSQMERKAMDAEREATRYMQILFLQDKIGMVFDGIISGVIARGIFVEMSQNKCEGMVRAELLGNEPFMYQENQVRLVGMNSGQRFSIGDAVKVKILSADIFTRRVELALAESPAAMPGKRVPKKTAGGKSKFIPRKRG